MEGLFPPINPALQVQMSQAFVRKLAQGEKPGMAAYKPTNPVRFVQLRSRQTIDVSAYTASDYRLPMFKEKDEGLATPVGGENVLTSEPLLEHAKPLDSGLALAIFAGTWQTNSADSTDANSRLTQRAMRGAFSYIRYTNRTVFGPHTVRLAGDGVNREDLVDGGGTTTVDGGVVLPDYRVNVEPNPMIIWPKSQVEPFIGFNGSRFAALSLTQDFQVIQTLFAMAVNVRTIGRGRS